MTDRSLDEDSPGMPPGRGGPSTIHKEASDKGPRGEAPGGAGSSSADETAAGARGEARPARDVLRIVCHAAGCDESVSLPCAPSFEHDELLRGMGWSVGEHEDFCPLHRERPARGTDGGER